MRSLIRRLRYLLRQRQFEADLADEMAFHREMKQRELELGGLKPAEAELATRRALGSFAAAGDHSRDVWHPRWLRGVGQDLRLAVRALRATPIVTTIAILSLALGIGANTAIFSLVNSLLLRVLPVVDPQRLVYVSSGLESAPELYSYDTWNQIRAHARGFDGAFAVQGASPGRVTLTRDGDAQSVESLFVSGEFFSTLGVPALRGRTFTLADDGPGGGSDGPVVVISYRLWQQRFGAAEGVIGTSLTIENIPFLIVGVTPPDFFGLEVGRAFDVALPIATYPLIRTGPGTPLNPDLEWLRVVLRLTPGQSLDAATAALQAAQPQIRAGTRPQRFPEAFMKDPFRLDPAGAGVSTLRRRFQRPLLAIFAVVALVLIIACANIANLLLARCAARRHELSVRVALGASRWRMARQLLIESAVLAAIGTGVGLVFSAWAGRAVVAQLSTSVARVALDVPLDWRVLAFTATAMVTTVLLFGVAPALQATHVAPMEALKAHARGMRADGHTPLSSGLIVTQVALSLLLVVAAGLFVRTFEALARMSLGFDRDRVLVATVAAGHVAVSPSNRNAFYHRLIAAAAAVPGVVHAGGSFGTPIIGSSGQLSVTLPGSEPMPDRERRTDFNVITPGWLATYGTPIRAGRDIDERDSNTAQAVTLVNEAFVRKFLAGRSAVGTALAPAIEAEVGASLPLGSKMIVGVVGDAVYRSVREPGTPTIYLPLAQWPIPIPPLLPFYISLRSRADAPALLSRGVAAALTARDRDLGLTFRPLAEQVDASLAQERLIAMLSGFFGGLGVLLAGLGLYGVTSYAVSRRRMEIGVRMALGADPEGVITLVLARVARLVALGVLVGAGVSVWATSFVASLLYGLTPRDPVTLIGAAVMLAVVGAVAGWLPAWRASRIDPAEVLREG